MHGKNHSLILLIWTMAVCVCKAGGIQHEVDIKHIVLCLSTYSDCVLSVHTHTNKNLVVLDVSLFGEHCWVLVCNRRGAFLSARMDQTLHSTAHKQGKSVDSLLRVTGLALLQESFLL